MTWTQAEAIDLCRKIEAICPQYGAHVALTGGTLYKDGSRKDADILFYNIRQVNEIKRDMLLWALQDQLGFVMGKQHGWCQKSTYQGKVVDLFFPELYPSSEFSEDDYGKAVSSNLDPEYKIEDF
jgi:hypothetical protein